MAFASTATAAQTNRPATGLFARFVAFLIASAEARPIMQALNALNATSDEQLAGRGLTRDGEIRRILGRYAMF